MPIPTTLWKTSFFRNDDKNCGAQNAAIAAAKPNHIFLHSHTRKNGRLWGHCTPEHLLKLLEDNRGIYEVIHAFPHKVYFDIDKPNDGTTSHAEFIQTIKQIIAEVFINAEMEISGSITESKISYHIILQNYVIHCEEERQIMKHIVRTMHARNDAFDWKVYTKNRNMKCTGQSKEDGRVQAILYDSSQDYKKHLITCFITDYPLPFPALSEEVQLEIRIQKAEGTFNLAELPKLVMPTPVGFDIQTASPTQLLSMIPLNSLDFNYSFVHFVARFCYHNGIDFDTYLSWLIRKHPNIQKTTEGQRKWNELEKFPPVSIQRIIAVLQYFYPHINKDIHYRRFCDSFVFDNARVEKIECITDQSFETPDKFTIFNVGMGGGKTFKTIENLWRYTNICWIAPNKSLANNTFKRLNDEHLNFAHYEHYNAKEKKAGELNKHRRMVVVQHSLHYISEQQYDCIVIDEIETVLNNWYGEFINAQGNKLKSWQMLLRIIASAKKVILLDAFTTKKTIDFCRCLGGDAPLIYERLNEPMTRTITYCDDFKEQVLHAIADLKKGLKLFIFFPFKSQTKDYPSMETLYTMLQNESGVKGVYYNADVDDQIKAGIKDVNKAWKDVRFIIANNMITCGVNYEIQDFSKEYIFVAKHNAPRDIVQFTYRPRYLSTNQINICYLGKMLAEDAWIDDRKTVMNGDSTYSKLYENILTEKKAPLKKTLQLFANKARYFQHTERKHDVADAVTKEFNDLHDKHQFGFDYKSIELIDSSWAEMIQQKCICLEATMWEKVALQKYFFYHKFKAGADTINAVYDGDDINVMETAWNEKLSFFFDKLNAVIQNEEHFFNRIMRENGWSTLFPQTAIPKAKLSAENKQAILENFSFKRPSAEMKNTHLIKSAYNVFFNKIVIESSVDDQKHCCFGCNHEWFGLFYTFATQFLKQAIVSEKPDQSSCAVEI
jgi:hypothetical protein